MNDHFIVIEFDVLDNENLTNTEKVLYGFIVALSKNKGYCYMKTENLCKLVNVKPRQLRRCLLKLKKFNYIATDVIKNKRIVKPTINEFIENRDKQNTNKKIKKLYDYNWLEDDE